MEKLSHSELMQQSLEEATFYMTSAIEIINDKFNDSSYAENHPNFRGFHANRCHCQFRIGIAE